MSDEIAIQSGIRGTRQLAAAFANVCLRNRGLLIDGKPTLTATKYIALGDRARRMWRADEIKRARELRAKGFTLAAIGAVLNRSKAAVHYQVAR